MSLGSLSSLTVDGDEAATEFSYKVLMVGEPHAGKTAFVQRYVEGRFTANYKTTIGVDFALKTVKHADGSTINLQDVMGQERFGHLTRCYYKGAAGAFIAFDITSGSSFASVLKWKEDVDNKVRLPNGDKIPAVLLANKCDLVREKVSEEIMNDFCKAHGFVRWFVTSAKANANVRQAMDYLTEVMHRTRNQPPPSSTATTNDSLGINDAISVGPLLPHNGHTTPEMRKKSCCC